MTKKARILLIVCFVSAVLLMGTAFYTQVHYHADQAALDALVSDELVTVTETDYGWFFDGPSDENAFIFYPGGKVEEDAYAPLLHALASQGLDVMLLNMPARLAILNTDAAEDVLALYDYDHWYIGGHSLGGASAALYAAENTDKYDGAIFLGSFSTKPLGDMRVLCVYGTEDGVLNMEEYEQSLANVSANEEEFVIEGGNHAQFGSYGAQNGDGKASISAQEQVEITVSVIIPFVQEGQQ